MSAHVFEHVYNNNKYKLINAQINHQDNAFTVIIGRNATGKSCLLSSLIKTTRNHIKNKDKHLGEFFNHFNNHDFFCSKIIAITSTPFDKFPNPTKKELSTKGIYKYLGFRDRSAYTTKTSQLSKIISSLIRSINKSRESLAKLSETFSLLGFKPSVTAIYKLRYNPYRNYTNINIHEYIENCLRNKNELLSDVKIDRIVKAFERIHSYYGLGSKISISLDFTGGGISRGSLDLFEDICMLLDIGLVVYGDLLLLRKNSHYETSINNTSSGERCVLINLLGIASEIENSSLICIDEPEISLHPEWQEKYMDLLESTFMHYFGCHFIIATHSPQIISKLNQENCFILTMDGATTYSSADFSNRSSDYQLARIFQAPGYQNEYLMTESLEILSKISLGESFTDDMYKRADELKNISKKLDPADPVSKLISTIDKAFKVLGK